MRSRSQNSVAETETTDITARLCVLYCIYHMRVSWAQSSSQLRTYVVNREKHRVFSGYRILRFCSRSRNVEHRRGPTAKKNRTGLRNKIRIYHGVMSRVQGRKRGVISTFEGGGRGNGHDVDRWFSRCWKDVCVWGVLTSCIPVVACMIIDRGGRRNKASFRRSVV